MRTCPVMMIFLLHLGLCQQMPAATVFYDDFDDGNAADGTPVTWVVQGAWPFGTFNVADGDLRVTATQSGSPAVIGVSALTLGDASIRAQVRLEGTSDESVAVFLRGAESGGVGKSHAIEIAADGGLWVGVANEFVPMNSDLRPTEEEIILQIDAIGDTISYWAWRASEGMPTEPVREYTNNELSLGIPGVYYAISSPPQVNPGIAVYRYVHVADSPIPERPTTAGDFNGNILLDAGDVDALAARIRGNSTDAYFDVDGDNQVTSTDLNYWVRELKNTWFGDADLSGEFNSADFVQVFQAGKYETTDSGQVGLRETGTPMELSPVMIWCSPFRMAATSKDRGQTWRRCRSRAAWCC